MSLYLRAKSAQIKVLYTEKWGSAVSESTEKLPPSTVQLQWGSQSLRHLTKCLVSEPCGPIIDMFLSIKYTYIEQWGITLITDRPKGVTWAFSSCHPSTALCLVPSPSIWAGPLRALLAREKQRQPKTWPKLWPSSVWSSTALTGWTTLLWASSSKWVQFFHQLKLNWLATLVIQTKKLVSYTLVKVVIIVDQQKKVLGAYSFRWKSVRSDASTL